MQRTEVDKDVRWLKIHGQANPSMTLKWGNAHLGYLPEVGKRMMLEDDYHGIVTSTVTGVEQLSCGLLVRTLNSIYYVEYLD